MDLPVILIVEDDPLLQGLVEEALKEGGFETAIVGSGEEALTLLKGHNARIGRSRPTSISRAR